MKMIYHSFEKLVNKIVCFFYYKIIRFGVTKKDFTIVSTDCCGGMCYHQLGKKFCSPFINLWLNIDDFILLINDFHSFINAELVEEKISTNYPIGSLKSAKSNSKIYINFLHYKNFEEALEKWNERKKRIYFDRLFFLVNLTNITNKQKCDAIIKRLKNTNRHILVLSRFKSDEKFVKRIRLSLKRYRNAQICNFPSFPFRITCIRKLDRINYKKTFSIFN